MVESLSTYGVVLAAMGLTTNMDVKSSNILSFINSTATPILLGLFGIFLLKSSISAWLKWSSPEVEQETTSCTREVDEKPRHP